MAKKKSKKLDKRSKILGMGVILNVKTDKNKK